MPSRLWKKRRNINCFSNSECLDTVNILMEDEVEKGVKVELRFWLAQELHLRQAASISIPASFSQSNRTRKEIQADATCVDLRLRCPSKSWDARLCHCKF